MKFIVANSVFLRCPLPLSCRGSFVPDLVDYLSAFGFDVGRRLIGSSCVYLKISKLGGVSFTVSHLFAVVRRFCYERAYNLPRFSQLCCLTADDVPVFERGDAI